MWLFPAFGDFAFSMKLLSKTSASSGEDARRGRGVQDGPARNPPEAQVTGICMSYS